MRKEETERIPQGGFAQDAKGQGRKEERNGLAAKVENK